MSELLNPISPDNGWEQFKGTIRSLWKTHSLQEVMKIMADRHSFLASEYQYRKQLREWGFTKYQRSEHWKIMADKVNKRKQNNKESAVFLDGDPISPELFQRKSSRHFMSMVERFTRESSSQTPPGFSILTPQPTIDVPSPTDSTCEEDLKFTQLRRNAQKTRQRTSSGSSSSSLALLVDASQADLTSNERWFLNFFRCATAQTNATYFSKSFWAELVHQASEIQPAVRHAAIGIGSLHWSGMMKGDDRVASFSLRQCSKALSYLHHNMVADISSRQRMETVMISCSILVAIAFSQGDARAGGCHLRAGYELLEEWQKFKMHNSPIGAIVLQSFTQIHLDWLPLTDPSADSKGYSYPLQLAKSYQMEVLIETPEEACGILLILGWLVLQTKPQPYTSADVESAPAAVLKRLRYWKSLIMQRRGYLSRQGRDTISILDIWSEVILIKELTDRRLDEGEMRYDDYLPHFRRTVHLAKELLVPGSLPSSWTRTGIVAPLFFCAFRCRDWFVRLEALNLLSAWEYEQGIWSISGPALVLERLIMVESGSCLPQDIIPESTRIDAVHVDFMPDESKVRFWYRRPICEDPRGYSDNIWVWDSEIIPY